MHTDSFQKFSKAKGTMSRVFHLFGQRVDMNIQQFNTGSCCVAVPMNEKARSGW